MSKRWFQTAMVLAALTIAVPLHADQGKGKAKGNPHKNQAGDQDNDRDDDRWERRGEYEYRTYGDRDGTPPGWSKAKKTGWGNCGLPPGQAKKYGCQTYRYQDRDYYYYRDEVGRIVVRRPHIHIDIR
jgi:hypothetical protein